MQTILSEVTWRNFDRNGDVAIMAARSKCKPPSRGTTRLHFVTRPRKEAEPMGSWDQ
ncbi:unnamed protein product [Symbiodinium pilosum]|uniref:Uncharacterized protein n=1 Tax=Symbiodinium pilosum TaxID=2952 RepID=A0A812W6G4_SYMPI|nr:unnamed protein product [Symbiodinium pilosum]